MRRTLSQLKYIVLTDIPRWPNVWICWRGEAGLPSFTTRCRPTRATPSSSWTWGSTPGTRGSTRTRPSILQSKILQLSIEQLGLMLILFRNLAVMAKFGKMMMADDCDYILPVNKFRSLGDKWWVINYNSSINYKVFFVLILFLHESWYKYHIVLS